MYIFVAMRIDLRHLIDSIKLSFPPETHVVLSGTIQFNKEVHAAKKALATHFRAMDVPQAKPLSSGEVLGCTAPRLLPAASSFMSCSSALKELVSSVSFFFLSRCSCGRVT